MAGGIGSVGECGVAAAVALPMATAARQVDVELQSVAVAHIAHPRREIGPRVAAQAYQP